MRTLELAGLKNYEVEVVAHHSVTIRWAFKDVPGADYDYREKFEKRVLTACHHACQDFKVSHKSRHFYPMSNFDHKLIIIEGVDPDRVRKAGEALAKAIFSHRYVEPSNHNKGVL